MKHRFIRKILLIPALVLILTSVLALTVYGTDDEIPEVPETETTEIATEETPEPEVPVITDGGIMLTVLNFATGNGVESAVFGVYTLSDVKLYEMTTDTNGEAGISSVPQGEYYLRQIRAVGGYELNTEKYGITVIPDDTARIVVTLTEIPEPETPVIADGNIMVTVTDSETNIPVKDIVFGIYTLSDVKIGEMTTDNNGEAVISQIPQGEYYLKQITAPDGYESDINKYGVTIKADMTTEISLTAVKTPEPMRVITDGNVKLIIKDSSTNKGVKDMIFGMYTFGDVKIGELTTDTNGESVILTVPQGEYYLKQITAPNDYEPDTSKYGVTVKADMTAEISLTAVKKPIAAVGRIKLTVIDSETGRGVKDALFGVYTISNGTRICDMKTDVYGEVVVLSVPQGEYYLRHIEAPDGYDLDTTRYGLIVITDITTEITLTLTVTKTSIPEPPAEPEITDGGIKLTVKDSETSKPVKNAVFGIYTVSADLRINVMKTDSYGEAVISQIPQGEYYLKEIASPDGYESDSDKHSVTVKSGVTSEIVLTLVLIKPSIPVPETVSEVKPEPVPQTKPESTVVAPVLKGEVLIINKAEYSGNSLSGAVFGIYSKDTGDKVIELTTNIDGKAVTELESGEYYLRELKAAKGYATEDSKIYFTVITGEIVRVEVTNVITDTSSDKIISIPKTGIDLPIGNYIISFILFGFVILGVVFMSDRKRIKRT